MELTNITEEIFKSTKRLEEGSKEIFKLGERAAIAEKNYRVALAKETLRLREVEKMPSTLIRDVARGNVADLKFERDIAEKLWTSAREALHSIEAQQMGLQSILKRQDEV